MTRTIVRKVGVFKISLIVGIIMFFVSLVFVIPLALVMGIAGASEMSWFALGWVALVIIMPFLYGILAFVFTAISCLLYNLVANWVGGIELELETVD